jgi:hypothetical protein
VDGRPSASHAFLSFAESASNSPVLRIGPDLLSNRQPSRSIVSIFLTTYVVLVCVVIRSLVLSCDISDRSILLIEAKDIGIFSHTCEKLKVTVRLRLRLKAREP